MNDKRRNSFTFATVLFVSMFFLIGTITAQEASVADNASNAATISNLVDRIDELKGERKELKSIDKNALSEAERIAWKDELKSVRKELKKERNKLDAIQDMNNPWRNGYAYGPGFWGPYWGGVGFGYSPFFYGGFYRPFVRFGGFYY